MNSLYASDAEKTALLVSVAADQATDDERAEAAALAKQDRAAAATLALARSSAAAITASEKTVQSDWSPGEMGLRRLLRDIDREEDEKRLAWTDSVALWRAVAAVAIVAVAVLGTLRLSESGQSREGYRIATSGDARAVAQITFAPTAREAEIRALLLKTGGTLIDGPSALGVYKLSFVDARTRNAAVSHLGSASIVESVSAD